MNHESGKKAIDQISKLLGGVVEIKKQLAQLWKNIHEAFDMIKAPIANQQTMYGSSKAYYHRQISFVPCRL